MRVLHHQFTRTPWSVLSFAGDTHLLRGLLVLLVLLCGAMRSSAEWREVSGSADIAYFLSADEGAYRIERYSLESESWLAPLPLPDLNGPPTTFHVGAGGIYVAYGRAIKRYDLSGARETHVGSFADDVAQILQDRELLFVNLTPSSSTTHLLSLDARTFAILSTAAPTGAYIFSVGFSQAPGLRRLYGRSAASWPPDVVSYPYDDAGGFGVETDSPYHGSFPDARSTWVFPGEQRVADDSGFVYWTSNLTYSARLTGRDSIRRMVFLTNAEPVALWRDQLVRYTPAGFPLGTLEVTNTVRTLFALGTRVMLFRPEDSSRGIRADVIEAEDIHSTQTAGPPDPVALRYTPSAFAVDRNGIVLLCAPEHSALFRWDPGAQAYLGTVPLAETPTHLAYSAASHAVFVAHSNGVVGKVLLEPQAPAEVPFAVLPSVPTALAMTGDFLFAADYLVQQTIDSSGTGGLPKFGNSRREIPLWSGALEKLFYRSPYYLGLVAERIHASTPDIGFPLGSIGPEQAGPYLQLDTGLPLLVSADGKNILTQSGRFVDTGNLGLGITGLANFIDDAFVGANGDLLTVRHLEGGLEVQEWDPESYALKRSQRLPGLPLRFLRGAGSTAVVIAQATSGDVIFHVLDEALNLVLPAGLGPVLRLEYVIESRQQFRLSWAAVQGAAGYRLDRRADGVGDWELVARTDAATTSLADVNVQASKIYSYRVVATNGTMVSASAEIQAGALPPDAPQNLRFLAVSPLEVQVEWDAVDGVDGYIAEISSESSPEWRTFASLPPGEPSYRYANLNPVTHYRFRIRATNFFGVSQPSALVEATTPQAPAEIASPGFVGGVQPFAITVYWNYVLYATGGVIERRTLPGGDWSVRAEVAAGSFMVSDDPALPATRYEYRAYATNELGRSAYSSIVPAETPPKPAPGMPYLWILRPLSTTSLRLDWSPIEFEDGFRIERHPSTGDTNWVQVATVGPNRHSFIDSQLVEGLLYSYRVQAFNDVGDSEFSFPLSGQTEDVVAVFDERFNPSPSPFNWSQITGGEVHELDAAGHPWGALVCDGSPGSQAVTLPLDLRTGGILTFDQQDALTRSPIFYSPPPLLEFSTDGGHLWKAVSYPFQTDPETPDWITRGLIIRLEMQTRQTMLRWRSDSPQWYLPRPWALDNVRIIARRPAAPSAPPYLVASPNSAHSITLLWGAVPGAREFDVERRVGNQAWQPLHSVSANDSFYTDDMAVPGVVNAYRVRAANPGGASSYAGPTVVHTWSALQQWNYDQFGDPDFLSGAQLDATDVDGLTPRLRYAFNLDADGPGHTLVAGGASGLPRVWLDHDAGALSVEFLRRRADTASGIVYAVQFSSDLLEWTEAGLPAQVAPVDVLWETARFRDPIPASRASARYCRVVVRPAP